ncbi:hypothetical protein [Flavobacterium sp. DG2-3]|uniref:hypothetical protein n=1 Tax=Flavobacterium sp. DG2-3 TaxID=3068317 RepID=UPI00273F69DD|nr:hypothetical protein [Flavobacterium sp. DG2-3]MDP5201231.1 hypothetical protein [Flavobacterium sp. DG2-3]
MRFVVKPDTDKTVKLSSPNTYNELLDIAKTKNKDNIKDSIYRDSYDTADEIRSKVEDKLALSYHNKCAYCERLCKADVEHYRPKKKVSGDDKHEGYYWLCYEWTNLLPSCVKCNRDGGKHNYFPIIGRRIYTPKFLKDGNLNLDNNKAKNKPLKIERPYLLHPEIDKPEDFFEFEIDPIGEGIKIKGIDKDGRGEKTIKICLLNRQELTIERVENVINDFKNSIECLLILYDNGEFTDNELVNHVVLQVKMLISRSKNEKSTHTLLRKYIVKDVTNFEKIVIPFFPNKLKKIVLEAFKSV